MLFDVDTVDDLKSSVRKLATFKRVRLKGVKGAMSNRRILEHIYKFLPFEEQILHCRVSKSFNEHLRRVPM